MAKKKTKTKRGGRRRMGGLIPKKYQQDSMLTGGVVLGLLVARSAPAIINKIAPGADPRIVNGVQAAIGVVGAVMTPKYPLVRGIGIGVAAMGAMDLLTNMRILPAANSVGAEEVVLSLDNPIGGAGHGYPTALVAGGMGAKYDGSYVDNVIAGMGML